MKENLQTDIRAQIKQALNLVVDNVISDAKLLEMLRVARIAKHPDKFLDEEAKRTAEEEFKKLDTLFKNFRIILEQERASSPASEIALYNERFAEIDRINKLASSEDEVFALKSKIKDLETKLLSKELEIEQLQQQNSILSEQNLKDNISGLENIYKPKTSTKVAGIISLSILLLTNVAIIKKQLTQILILSEDTLNWIFLAILTISLLSMAYDYLCNHRLKILFSRFSLLSILKDIHTTAQYNYKRGYNERYMTETDIEEFVSLKINSSKIDKILFVLKRDIIQKSLKNYIVTELTAKKIAKYGMPNMINRKFMLTSNE